MKRFYRQLEVQEYSDGDFATPAGYQHKRYFRGLIQAPSSSNTFLNGKDTSTVDAVLFCDKAETFESKDIIVDGSTKYKISPTPAQTNGITGIKPRRGQHTEYNLQFITGV